MKFARVLFFLILGSLSFFALVGVLLAASLMMLPSVHELEKCITTSMYDVRLCPSGSHYAKLSEIAPEAVQAVIASEDAAFYSHHGFDWYEIEQSLKTNLLEKHIHRGGSTITQQLAKNIWLSKEKSYWRKAKEAYLTYELEHTYSKDFIIEKYLNVVQFGDGLFGIKDAAQRYFNKSPSQLHLLDAVYLAFLLPNPPVYAKSFNKGQLTPFGRKIVSIILKRMVQFRKITPGAYQLAVNNVGGFPWRDLSQADFENAKGSALVNVEESPQDEKDIDRFLSDEAADENDGAPVAKPVKAVVPVEPTAEAEQASPEQAPVKVEAPEPPAPDAQPQPDDTPEGQN